jgi:hypothetical protein
MRCGLRPLEFVVIRSIAYDGGFDRESPDGQGNSSGTHGMLARIGGQQNSRVGSVNAVLSYDNKRDERDPVKVDLTCRMRSMAWGRPAASSAPSANSR